VDKYVRRSSGESPWLFWRTEAERNDRALKAAQRELESVRASWRQAEIVAAEQRYQLEAAQQKLVAHEEVNRCAVAFLKATSRPTAEFLKAENALRAALARVEEN